LVTLHKSLEKTNRGSIDDVQSLRDESVDQEGCGAGLENQHNNNFVLRCSELWLLPQFHTKIILECFENQAPGWFGSQNTIVGNDYRPDALFVTQHTLGDFTFWISLSLRQNFGLRPNLIQKEK